jgi:hypothetical protein
MSLISFGCSGEEQGHVLGAQLMGRQLIPYARGPGRFVSAGHSAGRGSGLPQFISAGANPELVPYSGGKKPKFISAGDDVGSDGFVSGVGQGAGIGVGLVAAGILYSLARHRKLP